ncbi:MAG: outer membrane protein assembly factor BamB [Pseudomonadota bacterium]
MIRAAAAGFLALLVSGCSLFGGDDELKPAKLIDFTPEIAVKRAWSVEVGGKSKLPLGGLRPSVRGGKVHAAGAGGRVRSIDPATGRILWTTELDEPLSAGPGLGDDLILVGSLDGEVIALDEVTGAERWRAQTSSEILAAPQAADGMVIVRSQDGRVFGFESETGRRAWVYDQSVPLLTLRGTGEPLLRGGYAYLGFDNGRMAALRIADGTVVWEQTVSAPQGRTELERIVDIDGAMVMVASDIYTVTYQGLLAALTANSGRLLWVKDMSSAGGVSVSRTQLAVADSNDAVWGIDRLTGGTLWKQDALVRRLVTGPAYHGDAVVVGDFEGYLHWMAEDDGRFVARQKAGSSGLVVRPQVVGNLLIVQSQDGKVSAFEAAP